MDDMRHLEFLDKVARADVAHIKRREATYRGSWKRRGGVGAFMMLARKWDRLESILGNRREGQWNVLSNSGDGSDGTVLAEIRDLRQYLLLVESEIEAQAALRPGTPEDGGHHARQEDDGA